MPRSLVAIACSLFLAACVFAQPLPETQTEFVPTGEIVFGSIGASFDAVRVRKANCSLSKRSDGSWGGTMADGIGSTTAIDVSVTPRRAAGSGLTLVLEESGGEKGTVITGQFQGNMVRFEIGPKQALIRTSIISTTLARSSPTSFGSRGELQFKGEAALAEQPWPQFALAMLAAFTTN